MSRPPALTEPLLPTASRALAQKTRTPQSRDLQPTARPPTLETTQSRRPSVEHLTQCDLSRRWRISPRTLERWRWLNQGPPYLKIGGRVVYALQDIEAYEVTRRR
jgi:hypothetical protein